MKPKKLQANCAIQRTLLCKGIAFGILKYTNDIKIKEPNLHTPFRQIKGVLMEYQLLSNNILMNFSATKVIDEKVDKSAIELEEGYEMVEPAKLKAEIKKLFTNIM